ncbi:hypothetical protein [Segniliparus rugosus]|uniref:Uncharacterized protein n=1 Tax=Segniliparus rugosus (strain ATCC BAA-974 / DSM 45345 / CCUG 50838 / CIP 108380 / JCM 13579 / CDC 945) TaxID=679197 RepID=E5XQK9_SEGRC|nr:hypothetical protein [Segniliparus rugosus]EFV13359.1 hypothetical protein HMPREF9336_01781 [Segniliparus rugosus ATCC BAA-974]
MDPVEQLYHLQRESQKQTQQLQRETNAGFEYLRKSAESSSRRVQQSLSSTGPQSARSADRGWGASTRNIGNSAAAHEVKSAEETVPAELPSELRNILIRNQQMEARWQREFAARLRSAGEARPGASSARSSDPRQQAEQQRIAQQAQLAAQNRAEQQRAAELARQAAALRTGAQQPGARAKGRGWGDSTRRIGSGYGDE